MRQKPATRAVAAGRRPEHQAGAIHPPVHHASTYVAPTLEAFERMGRIRRGEALTYALHGVPATFALEEALVAMEGGHRARICNSGLTAITAPLLAVLSAGDHLLMTDAVYDPVRAFCDRMLTRFGVETTYYDPLIGAEIADLIRPDTRAIFLESPASLTFEVQDVPAIVGVAKARGLWTLLDNTWASPLCFQPIGHGVDFSIQALTKYVGGHSDLILGAVIASEKAYRALQPAWGDLGVSAGPDDVARAHRGLCTLPMRMAQHQAAGLRLAEWLAAQPEVLEILHPARPSDPGHALWARDFDGAGGLFGFLLDPSCGTKARLSALLDELEHFAMGFSWGGVRSMLIPARPTRSASPWPRPGRPQGQLMRIFAGLEDPEDLISDLEAGFERMRRA